MNDIGLEAEVVSVHKEKERTEIYLRIEKSDARYRVKGGIKLLVPTGCAVDLYNPGLKWKVTISDPSEDQ